MDVLQRLREWELSSLQALNLQKPEKTNIKLLKDVSDLNSDQPNMSSVVSTSLSNNESAIMTTPLIFKSVQSNIISQRKYQQDPLGQYYRSLIGIAYTKYKINNIDFYCCMHCKQYMKTFNAICNHINKHRNAAPYKCNLCVRQYTTQSVLNRHFKQKHCNDIATSIKIKYNCPICHKEFLDKQVFYIHLRTEISNQSTDASSQAIEAKIQSQSNRQWLTESIETGSQSIRNESQSIVESIVTGF